MSSSSTQLRLRMGKIFCKLQHNPGGIRCPNVCVTLHQAHEGGIRARFSSRKDTIIQWICPKILANYRFSRQFPAHGNAELNLIRLVHSGYSPFLQISDNNVLKRTLSYPAHQRTPKSLTLCDMPPGSSHVPWQHGDSVYLSLSLIING